MAELDRNGLLVYLQHKPKILLRNLDLFISPLGPLGSSLTFWYILVRQTVDCRRGKSGSVSGCSVVRPAQLLTVMEAGCQLPGGVGHYPFSPELKVANFALLLSVRQTENRINRICRAHAISLAQRWSPMASCYLFGQHITYTQERPLAVGPIRPYNDLKGLQEDLSLASNLTPIKRSPPTKLYSQAFVYKPTAATR